jgi:hypothetical protein
MSIGVQGNSDLMEPTCAVKGDTADDPDVDINLLVRVFSKMWIVAFDGVPMKQ